MERPPHDDLEQRIHRLLRDLPGHRAPDALEDRVLAVLAAREALPWWRRSYSAWPVAARVAFLVGSAIAAALVIAASIAGLREVAPVATVPIADALGWWAQVKDAAAVLTSLVAERLPSVSGVWMQIGIVAVVAAYGTLMGLGAAAYRFLKVRR
jgi:hypothetical protein